MPVKAVAPQLRGKILAAVPHVRDGIDQMARRPILQQVSIAAGSHDLANDVVIRRPGKDDYFGAEGFAAHAPHQLDPVHFREIEVNHGDVGAQPANLIQRGFAIRTLRDYDELRISLEHSGQTVAAKRILIGEEDREFIG
jgi:hypothetical protein